MSRARDLANLGDQAGSGFDASDLTTGTLGNTVQDNITRLGTVITGTFNGTIGSSSTQATDRIIKHHAFTAQKNSYINTASSTWLTTGNGWSGTTSSQTSKLIVFATGQNMSYFSSGASFANGGVKLVYHSDAITQGASPSGSDLGSETNSGGYSVSLASGRKDLYLSWTLYITVSVSASTAYNIQVASMKLSGTYFNIEAKTTGFVMEVK